MDAGCRIVTHLLMHCRAVHAIRFHPKHGNNPVDLDIAILFDFAYNTINKGDDGESTPRSNVTVSRRQWKPGTSRTWQKITPELHAQSLLTSRLRLTSYVTGNAYACMA